MSNSYDALIDEVMEMTIKTARRNGVDVMGLDYPALNVRESLKNWFTFAEDAPELPTKDPIHAKEELNLSGKVVSQFEAQAHSTVIDDQLDAKGLAQCVLPFLSAAEKLRLAKLSKESMQHHVMCPNKRN
jgi:hypothetical protein